MTVEDGASACRTGAVFISCRYILRVLFVDVYWSEMFLRYDADRSINHSLPVTVSLFQICSRSSQPDILIMYTQLIEADRSTINKTYLYAGWIHKKRHSLRSIFILSTDTMRRASSRKSLLILGNQVEVSLVILQAWSSCNQVHP